MSEVALEDSLELLTRSLEELHEAVDALRVMLVEDRPAGDDVLLFDLLGDALTDSQGWLGEASAFALRVQESFARTTDASLARRELAAAHERFDRFAERLSGDLCAYERLEELTALARERGEECSRWAAGLREALAACERLARGCNRALFACWREAAAQGSNASFSVQNTNVGPVLEMEGATVSPPRKARRKAAARRDADQRAAKHMKQTRETPTAG